MTLHDFLTEHGTRTMAYGNDGYSRLIFERDYPRAASWDLFHLSDFVIVAAVSGPGFVLVPHLRG